MRRIALLLAAVMLALPASAQAGVRHASPTGTGSECSEFNPCLLETAVGGALAGDEIVVAPGTHALSAALTPTVPLTIHGTVGLPRPHIVAPTGSPALDSGATLSISDLTLESVDASSALTLAGDNSSAERVEAVATSSGGSAAIAMRPGNGVVVRDSLLRASSPTDAEALFYQATAPGSVTLRNVTAVASAPHSIGLDIFATAAAPTASIEAVNVIADAGIDLSASADPASTSAINLFNSNFNSGDRRGGTIGGGGNQILPPQFVNGAAGDFRQAAGSPTIDAGLTDPANGGLDLAGNPRTLNGRTDIGAYEIQPVSAPPPVRDTTAASTVIGRLRLSRTGVVSTTLACPAGEARCNWAYSLRSARSVVVAAKRKKRKRRVLRLGSGHASAPGGRRVTVRIKLSKRNFRLIKRRKRLRVKLTVRTTDAAANAAIAKKTSTLRAPKRRARARAAARSAGGRSSRIAGGRPSRPA